MRIILLGLIIIIFFNISVSQKIDTASYFTHWSLEEYNKANSAKDIPYLSKEEKDVFLYMNLARINPKLFANTFLKQQIDSNRIEPNNYVTSLISTLKKQKPLPPLIPDVELIQIANLYAESMGKQGLVGHYNYEKRFKNIMQKYSISGENCDFGDSIGFDIVLDLLIDEDVINYGHRKNILSSDFSKAGVSIKPHSKYAYCCVIDFAGKEYASLNYKKKKIFSFLFFVNR